MARASRKNNSTTCYMCDQKFTSKEHVPPKTFFPEKDDFGADVDYRKNLITVPSCDAHNIQKSDDDQYLLFVIVSSFRASSKAQSMFSQKIVRTLKRRPLMTSFFKNNFEVSIGNRKTMAYEVDRKRFDDSISKIASALYFHTFREKWNGSFFVYSPDIFSVKQNAENVNKTIQDLEAPTNKILASQDFLGENPEIFRYKIFRKDNWFITRILFYQGVVVNAFSDDNQFLQSAE